MSDAGFPPFSKPEERVGPMLYMGTASEGREPSDVVAIGAVFTALPAIAIALRIYTRIRVTGFGLSADDWLMIVAFTLNLGMGLMLIVGAAVNGLDQPTPQGWGPYDYFWVTDDALILTEKIFWAFIMIQALAFGFVKLSILYFYRRIFASRTFSILSYILIGLVVAWMVGFFFAYMFRCGTQFWALWAPLMYLLEYCYDSKPMFYTLCISDVITDFFILSLPWYWIWRLNMSVAKRLAIAGVFLLGFLEIGTGVARLVIFINQTSDWVQIADGNGLLTTLMIWSMIEVGIAVVAGCLPTIWPLVSKVSIEDMMRTLKSVLSLESLRSRGSTTKGSSLHSGEKDSSALTEKQTGHDDKSQRQGSSRGGNGQNPSTGGFYGQNRSGNNSASGGEGHGIGVKKDVSVVQKPVGAQDNSPPTNVPADQDPSLYVHTDTQIYSHKNGDNV